jgi:ubiquitin carboxyl-terminal hydrolase 22/27/51
MNLDLRPFSQDPGRYALVAIGEHKGNIEGGHYVAYCKRGKNWCKFDDDRVRRIHRSDVASTQAYMLVYSRK